MPKLYLVPTPIGNLEDITLRALKVLKEVNAILAEDTRKTGILLKHFGIGNKLIAHHMHNEHRTAESIAARIALGESVALVTDAGTPGISDPGFLLVRACIAMGVEVESLPGPTAFVPALVNSGLPCDRFYFEGFLPHKKGRQTRLKFLSVLPCTFVLYESPFRLVRSLEQMAEILGPERKACVSRELTKLYEENRRGTLSGLAEYYSQGTPKGEIVIVVAGIGNHDDITSSASDE
ncbi:MAG: 16S rRNA (cytidine(1402)-2'-O)-methyltransferase [Bacteroidota bacterium]